MSEPRPASKLWLETKDGYVFGPGVYNLLIAIKKTGTLKEASQQLGMSYRYAWGLIKNAEETLGESLIDATKGGSRGGGSSSITETGNRFIMDFELVQAQWGSFTDSIKNEGNVVSVSGDHVTLKMRNTSQLEEGDKVLVSKA